MDFGLGLNFNSFIPQQSGLKPNQVPLEAGSDQETEGQGFMAMMAQEEVSSQSFGKPIPTPAADPLSSMNGFFQAAPVERVLPQQIQSRDGMSISQNAVTQKVDTLTKRVAWQKFLQKMKSELNVSAEEILQAFQALTPQELQQSPEKNIEKLVANLGLNPEQSQIASQLFTELIDRTGSQPLASELKRSERDINLSVMSQRDQEQRKMSEAIDRMNQQFFMKGPENQVQASTTPLQSGTEFSPELLAQMKPVDEMESQRLVEELGLNDIAQQSQSATERSPSTLDQRFVQAMNSMKAPEQSVEVDESSNGEETSALGLNEALSKPQAKVTSKSSSSKAGDFLSQKGESAFTTSIPLENMSEAVVDKLNFSDALEVPVAGLEPKETFSTEDLIQEARLMVKDGGGEVKVILEPEGLGEVAMKVSVHGDKVNVEVITESDTAKKMLEKGMGDLRSHLQASNLSLETLKVDTAAQMEQNLERQYEDAQRQQAQHFMENFRQGNQEFKRGFFDMPGARLYQSQTKTKAPAVEAAPSTKAKEGRRLNLVA